jgi:hypothetical protein
MPPEADFYQARDVADRLSAAAASGGTAVLCQILTGLGGVGKTQLAVAHARRLWQAGELDLMVWVPASSRSAIVAGYAQAYAAVSGVDDPEAEQAAARLLALLASTERSWLIVLDDLTDPGLVRGLWPPNGASGGTLVTTRRRDAALAGSGRTLIDVNLFTPSEAESYLGAKLAAYPDLRYGADRLAQDLGYLPLALAQAATFLIDRGLTCVQYAERFADRRSRLVDVLPEHWALPDDHRATVAATWSLSIELANCLAPAGLARPILDLASLLDSEGIPETVFTTQAATRWLSGAVGREVDAESARDALRCLHRVSLVVVDEANSARRLRVHSLVQRSTRDHAPETHMAAVARIAADALLEAWPDVERDLELCQVLRACTAALSEGQPEALWTDADGGHDVLFRAGLSLGSVGQTSEAERYFDHLHTHALTRLGPDHPDTLTTRGNHARWRGEAGDAASATAVFEQLLADLRRVLGPEDPDTLTTRGHLAHWQGEARRCWRRRILRAAAC